ncbi:MAG: DUF4450 domain-containing protein [Armatimonadetes bacterium]|nr:DUF4450 domain-containing protein [Armatimonadota bacterium]
MVLNLRFGHLQLPTCALLLLIMAVALSASDRPDFSKVKVERIAIEKQWDKPVPSEVPEVDGVLFDGNFYRDQPNHPTLKPGDKAYTPIREGGFFIENGARYFNRPIFRMGNMLSTGDRPMFTIHRSFGTGWASKLRFALSTGDRARWLDEFPSIRTEFWPGSTDYICKDSALGVEVKLTAIAGVDGWSSLFKIEVNGPAAGKANLIWVFGDVESRIEKGPGLNHMYWVTGTALDPTDANEVSEVSPGVYRISVEPDKHDSWKNVRTSGLRNLKFYAGSKWPGQRIMLVDGSTVSSAPAGLKPAADGKLIACEAPVKKNWNGVMAVVWGGQPQDLSGYENAMRRLNIDWGMRLYREWYENYVGRGSKPYETFKEVMASPEKAFEDSVGFWRKIRSRVVVETPNDEITAWANWLAGSQEYLHWLVGQMCGLDSWGQGYLHISNMYDGWDYLGAHDQQEKWLRIFASSVRNGWIGLYHSVAPWMAPPDRANAGEEDQICHFLNCAYTNWLWTGNDQFLRDIWPFAKQLIERELMQSDPDGDGLFAARYGDWAPEDDSYGPKSQLQTAQALRALKGCVEMARVAGEAEAEKRYVDYIKKIERALPSLWDTASGVLGYRGPDDVLKINPATKDIFFPILRDAVDRLQGYQMLRYAREILWAGDEKYPGAARMIMCPYHVGKTELGPLTDNSWRTVAAAGIVGAVDEFWPVFKTMAHSYFFSSWPGGECVGVSACGSGHAGMNDHNDGRMPALYALGRGLFGLEPDVPHGKITIEPRFPSDWKKASISQPSISYSYEVKGDSVQMQVKTPKQLAKTLRIAVRQDVSGVKIDGKQATFTVEPGINRAYVVVDLPRGTRNTVVVKLKGKELKAEYQRRNSVGTPFTVSVPGAEKIELVDPQKAVKAAGQTTNTLQLIPIRTGDRTAFITATAGSISVYLPLDLEVSPDFNIVDPSFDTVSGKLRFTLLNPGGKTENLVARAKIAGSTQDVQIRLTGVDAKVELSLAESAIRSLTPGSNPIELQIDGRTYRHKFIDWDVCGPENQVLFNRTQLLDLAWDYNEEACDLFNTKFYYDAWMMGIDYPVTPSKTYEYAGHHLDNPKVDSPYFLAVGRIPFYVADEKKLGGIFQPYIGGGPRNVLAIANTRPWIFPSNLSIPLGKRKLSKVYFLAYSWYRAHQAHHPNVELVANYTDGTKKVRQLIPPFNFAPQYGRKSVNSNAYEIEVIESGLPSGLTTDVVDLPLDPTKPVESIEVRSVVSESIFAIFGITLVDAE